MDVLALGADERVSQVRVSEKALTVTLKDGRMIAVPLIWYPKLLNASPKQRKTGELQAAVTIFIGLNSTKI